MNINIYPHLLVNFAGHEDAAACRDAALVRFPDVLFDVKASGGCYGVYVEMPAGGPNCTPDDLPRYKQIQQFCAGFWYARRSA